MATIVIMRDSAVLRQRRHVPFLGKERDHSRANLLHVRLRRWQSLLLSWAGFQPNIFSFGPALGCDLIDFLDRAFSPAPL